MPLLKLCMTIDPEYLRFVQATATLRALHDRALYEPLNDYAQMVRQHVEDNMPWVLEDTFDE
jgi:hypothetical protein